MAGSPPPKFTPFADLEPSAPPAHVVRNTTRNVSLRFDQNGSRRSWDSGAGKSSNTSWDSAASRGARRSYSPLFTVLVIFVCLAVLLVEYGVNAAGYTAHQLPSEDCHFLFRVQHLRFCAATLSVNPLFGPTTATLERMGAVSAELIVGQRQVWRLVSGVFLHAGAVHCALNMFGMALVGGSLETHHGFVRTGSIFMLAGTFGALASATFAPHVVSVGASGAVFGLVGASLGDILLNWDLHARPCCSFFKLALVVATQLVIGTLPYLDNYAHSFGFLMGLISSFCFLARLRKRRHCAATCSRRAVRALACCCVLAGFAIGFGLLFRVGGADVKELCPSCERISCNAFPWGCEHRGRDACWWTCNMRPAGAYCSGKLLDPRPGETAGRVELKCPTDSGGFTPVVVESIATEAWSQQLVADLCRDYCKAT